MSEPISDVQFAAYVQKNGLATPAQLQAARERQASRARPGAPLSLPDALVEIGVVTPEQRDTAVQRIRTQMHGGIRQLLHYKLVRKLGEGGMGAVYLAEDAQQGRLVALKVLPRQHAGNPEFLKRFQREADAMGRLHHESIVRAYSVGEDQGRHFYVMEFCEGETLDRRLAREPGLPAAQAVSIVTQVTRGLRYAHAQGFVHRDIKPANIILTAGGVAKILDLGLTKNIEGAPSTFLTQSGVAMGTPHYISPEQARGERDLDGRADIYSLGATFYHIVTGDTPFHGSSAFEVVTRHLNDQLPDPRDVRPDIPEGVVHVIRRMMAKRREDRYRDCGELLEDLERVTAGRAPASRSIDAALTSVALPGARRKPARRRMRTPGSRKADAASAPVVPPGKVGCFIVTRRAAYGIGLAAVAALVPLAILSGRVGPAPEPESRRAPAAPVEMAKAADAERKALRESQAGEASEPALRRGPALARQDGAAQGRGDAAAREAPPASDGARARAAADEKAGTIAQAGMPVAKAESGKPLALTGAAAAPAPPAAPPPAAAPQPASAKAVAGDTEAGTVSLLARADPTSHAARGAWSRTREGHLVCPEARDDKRIAVPCDAGKAYDLRVVFVSGSGDEVRLHFDQGGREAILVLRLLGARKAILQPLAGEGRAIEGDLAAPLDLHREHAVTVQVRPERVDVLVNGAPAVAWKSDAGVLGRDRPEGEGARFAISRPFGALVVRAWAVTPR